jgi:hypothetical protein
MILLSHSKEASYERWGHSVFREIRCFRYLFRRL